MSLLAAASIEVGKAVAKFIFKLWVKDSEFGNDLSSSLIDLLGEKTSDVLAQRKGNRQFEEIGDKISETMRPLLENEGMHLEEGERTAVALAVAETLNKTRLSTTVLAERNLQPTQLLPHLLATNPNATRDLSAAGTALYERLIKESCTYVVDIASQLPPFTKDTFAEVLKREEQILDKANQILDDLQRIRQQLDPQVEAQRFEIEYREAIARNLDVLQLIGADVSLPNRRHKLSVAYITLSVEQKLPSPLLIADASVEYAQEETVEQKFPLSLADAFMERAQEEKNEVIVPVNIALTSSHRLLIRGLAGSGKTTLMQWIAVRAATKAFEGPLSDWNGAIPFYLRLRQYVQSELPRPEAFVNFTAPMIANTMPKDWVHRILKSGRALVLIDGVDELSVAKREEVHTWLRDLVETYKTNEEVRFIVTSRPHAIEEGWMNHEGFSDAELQPMGLSDISTFIDHWHRAVQEELHMDEDKAELEPLAKHLKEQVKHNRAIRMLATNPLLCAMLCALNRERRRHLPVNRIELYKACCALLLERRDKESRVDLSDYVAHTLTHSQKLRLLEVLAYSMIKANLSEATVAQVDASFTDKLTNMPNVPLDVSGTAVRKLFVERSGMLREPVAGYIDFTHRTFQEFFAAQAAMNVRDIKTLVANAHNDQWQELIILAAGLAPHRTDCEQLVKGLMGRGDLEMDIERSYRLHLLAISCLETAIELGPKVKVEVDKRLRQLVPPKDMTAAKALAAAGDLAVKYLVYKKQFPDTTAAACVRTLATVGSEAALEVLEGYASDEREAVVGELLKAWDSFDREMYARRILSQAFGKGRELHIIESSLVVYVEKAFDERKGPCTFHIPSLDGIQYFTGLTTLTLSNYWQVRDLIPLTHLTQLTRLELLDCSQVSDLTPLASLTQLTSLTLSNNDLKDLTPLASLTQLTSLTLSNCPQVSDLTPLVHLAQLTSLTLSNCPQVSDLTPLASLTQLTSLTLSDCSQVSDLTPLASLTQLTSLTLSNNDQLKDLTPLASLTQLSSLTLSSCPQVSDLTPLAHLTQLTVLDLSECSQVKDLRALIGLNELERLCLYGIHDQATIPHSVRERVSNIS